MSERIFPYTAEDASLSLETFVQTSRGIFLQLEPMFQEEQVFAG